MTPPEEIKVRPHTFDGIREYDQRLPNWWLYTLYATIIFWVGYWAYYEWFRIGPSDPVAVEQAISRIEATKMASTSKIDDASLWKMSQNATFVAGGKAVFETNCVACHFASMRGKAENPVAIGPDLTDTAWVYGGKPTQIYDLIMKGVLTKGMPTWGPVLGAKKVGEVTAYILSKHQEGEAIVIVPSP